MNMMELQMENASLARMNSGFVHVLAALVKQQPNHRLVIKKEWLLMISTGEIALESLKEEPSGDIVFLVVSSPTGSRPPNNVIPLEGPIG